MDRGNQDVSKQRTADPKTQFPSPEPDWRKIAEEASKEQDGTKLMELAHRLIDAFDHQHAASELIFTSEVSSRCSQIGAPVDSGFFSFSALGNLTAYETQQLQYPTLRFEGEPEQIA